jgi:MoaA/NifB/PqqE/SkfB family radical SAM enzyme
MILETKRYADYAKKILFRRNKLNFLILYVTSKCNLACGTCFFHENLNKQTDLKLWEYEKIARSVGLFSILAIGGGEPFLRHDLEKICSIFLEKGRADTLFIPTNGALAQAVLSKTENLLKKYPNVSISINPSLDGMAAYHDKNRGLPGTFAKCVETIKKLTELKKKYSNLQVIVNSVINRDNMEDLKKLMEFLKRFDIDFQAFEIMRGDYRNKELGLPNHDQIADMHDLILKNRYWYLARKKKSLKKKLLLKIEEILVLGTLKHSQIFKERALAGGKWPRACVAGRSILVINPDGSVGACEIHPPLASLRKNAYSLGKALKEKNAAKFIRNIKNKKCDCTHICFIHSAIAANPISLFNIFTGFLKAKKIIKS